MGNSKPKLTVLEKVLVAAGIAGGMYCLYIAVMFFVVFSAPSGGDPIKFYTANRAFLNEFARKVESENPSDYAAEDGQLKIPPEINDRIDMGYLFIEHGVLRIEFKTGGWAGGNHQMLIYKSDGTDLTQEEMRYEDATFERIDEHWFAVDWHD